VQRLGAGLEDQKNRENIYDGNLEKIDNSP